MICHRLNENTGAMKKLFEGEYRGLRKGHPVFVGDGGYIERVGPYDYKYRLKFESADELHTLIKDLIEVHNKRDDAESVLSLASMAEIIGSEDAA